MAALPNIETVIVESVAEADIEPFIDQLVADGVQVIFATSFGYGDGVLAAAERYPDIIFAHATGIQRAPNVMTYIADFYQNPHGAQLVFSTHDTSILDQDMFRPDQIWFCERNAHLETSLFPLSDFRPRRGVENLEKAYLAGRFGALPYIQGSSRQPSD